VDLDALPSPTAKQADESRTSPFEDLTLKRRVSRIVERILQFDSLAHDRDLLAMGADSLDFVRIVTQIELETGVHIDFDEVYRQPTIAGITRLCTTPSVVPEGGTAPRVEQRHGKVLNDPEARDAFKRSRLALRQFGACHDAIRLPGQPSEQTLAGFERRRSSRHFARDPVTLDRLGALLGVLREVDLDGKPKRVYGSAGGLYPVQVYVFAKPARVHGAEGLFYYQPREHALIRVSGENDIPDDAYDRFVNRPVFTEAAFAIYLVADVDAIEPLYGDQTMRYSCIEAGLMAQELERCAGSLGLGLCQIGQVDAGLLKSRLDLSERHEFVHSLLGGNLLPGSRE
jgi:SagB-type dehydrogenase family enzyme